MHEIYHCTSKYIWGFEYYSKGHIEIPYRNNEGLMWKANFAKLYSNEFPNLSLVKDRTLPYLGDKNIDHMFLLTK